MTKKEYIRFQNDFCETMKKIPGFPDYFISKDGKIFRVMEIKGKRPKNGYHVVSCWKKNKEQQFYMHRLLMQLFGPSPGPGQTHVAHLDGNPRNNALNNLVWATPQENEAHKKLHGRWQRGERATGAKLTERQVRNILSSSSGPDSDNALAKKYGVTASNISCIRRRISWRHL
jgi:hypothetical protein